MDLSSLPEGVVVVNIPITLTLTPQELDTIVGALELAPLSHRATDPILKKIGKTASEQCAKFAKSQSNGQRADNGGAPDGRGEGTSGEAVPTVPG